MSKGKVNCFDAKRGYGFITSEDGKKVFVYQSNIKMDGFRKLEEGQIVIFDIRSGKLGKPEAVNVEVVNQ